MRATIEININTKRKYGYVNLTMGYGNLYALVLKKMNLTV